MQSAVRIGHASLGRICLGSIAGLLSIFVVGFGLFLIAIAPHAPAAPASLALGLIGEKSDFVFYPDNTTPADAIVVLTGGGARIDEAVRLFKEGHARRLLITGVNRQTTRDELKRRLAINPVLFDCCVDIGYAALDTVGNADETKSWCGAWAFSRIIMVTANYHMPRSRLEFAHAMPGTEVIARPVAPPLFTEPRWWLNPHALAVVGTEYVKFIGAHLRLGTHAAITRFWPSGAVSPVARVAIAPGR